MVIAILGYPFAGKHALAEELAARLAMRMIAMDQVRETIEHGSSEWALRARTLVSEGRLLPDLLAGELLWEAAGGDGAIIVGRPRNLEELVAFERVSGRVPFVIHLEASQALVDQRMATAGLGASEAEHPGALRRISQALQPMLIRAGDAGRLLTLDASQPIEELVKSATPFIEQLRPFAG